jgi:hypothetical protein
VRGTNCTNAVFPIGLLLRDLIPGGMIGTKRSERIHDFDIKVGHGYGIRLGTSRWEQLLMLFDLLGFEIG